MFEFEERDKFTLSTLHSRYESDLDETMLGMIDYCRVSFRNVVVPFPNIQKCHSNTFYWTCHAFNELSRITGERIEFTAMTLSNGKYSVNAYCLFPSEAANYINPLIEALERGDHDAILSGELQPQEFTTRADPIREEDFRRAEIGPDTDDYENPFVSD